MTEYETRVARVCSRLNEANANYAVVGATAMQLWGTTRATRDVDILIQATVENAARVLHALGTLGFGIAADLRPEDVASRAVTMVGDTPNVDILTRAWNVQWDDARHRIAIFDVEGVPVPTVSLADLIESKRTGWLQDAADIEILEEIQRLREKGSR
ncbi:MAG: nucleotidyltransferase domain-containing protein [Gemmatimonadaceae bacterium]